MSNRTAVITVTGNKGGGGKSTIATQLAAGTAMRALSTVLIDVDPQGSAAEWGSGFEDDDLIVQPADAPTAARVIETARTGGADIVVVDTGAKSDAVVQTSLEASTLNLIVARPSRFDIKGIAASVEIARKAGVIDRTWVLLNACPHYGQRPAEAEAAVQELYGLPCCPVRVDRSEDFEHAANNSVHVSRVNRKGQAAADMSELTDWVLKTIKKGRG